MVIKYLKNGVFVDPFGNVITEEPIGTQKTRKVDSVKLTDKEEDKEK